MRIINRKQKFIKSKLFLISAIFLLFISVISMIILWNKVKSDDIASSNKIYKSNSKKLSPTYTPIPVKKINPILNSTPTSQATQVKQTNSSFDNVKPFVVILEPKNNSQLSNSIKIVANVTDNIGVDRVEFWAGSGDFEHIGTVSQSPYEIVWDINKKFGSNPYNIPLTVKAYDKAGNKGYDSININPFSSGRDMNGPDIVIIEPENESKVGRTITIKVSVSDNDGIKDVDVFAGSSMEKYIGRLSDEPRQITWNVDEQYYQQEYFPITIVAHDGQMNSTKKNIIVYPIH